MIQIQMSNNKDCSGLLRDRRVGLSGENYEPKYANFLCFIVSIQTSKLISKKGGIEYSNSQKETHNLVKSLYKRGLGYQSIAQLLNSKNITTFTEKEWNRSHVFAILKRYWERQERLSIIEEVFEPEISKFEVRCERN